MSINASTLIIENPNNFSTAEFLKKIYLFKTNQKIGAQNQKYQAAIQSKDGIYIAQISGKIIITGADLLELFAYEGLSMLYYLDYDLPDLDYLFFYQDQVSMTNAIFFKKDGVKTRKKIVKNGKYPKFRDIEMDQGEMLSEELHAYGEQASKELKDYIVGVKDLEISLNIAENHFGIQNLEEELNTLTFNENLSEKIGDEYIKNVNNKLSDKTIEKEFRNLMGTFAQSRDFNTLTTIGTNDKVDSTGFEIELSDCTLIIEPEFKPNFAKFDYRISIYFTEKPDWLNYKCFYNRTNYSVSIMSFRPSVIANLNKESNELVYTWKDFHLVKSDLQFLLNDLLALLRGTSSFRDLFKSSSLFERNVGLLKKNIEVCSKIWNTDELNYCLLYCKFNNDSSNVASLLSILDSDNEKNIAGIYQKYSREFIEYELKKG